MLPPQGYDKAAAEQVCKLNKSLYSLKQASRQWNHELTKFLIVLGYVQSRHGYSLFVKQKQGIFTTALVYVDDVLITRDSEAEIVHLKQALDNKFTIKDLGLPKYFLGIELSAFPLPTELKLSLDKGTPLDDPSAYRKLMAEYRVMAATTYKLLWLSYLLQGLQIKVKLPVTLFCDNKAA
ncbi:retrovirus-related pol polyprotein from transposon TNT 1-94 [Tanacetum coccineum]